MGRIPTQTRGRAVMLQLPGEAGDMAHEAAAIDISGKRRKLGLPGMISFDRDLGKTGTATRFEPDAEGQLVNP